MVAIAIVECPDLWGRKLNKIHMFKSDALKHHHLLVTMHQSSSHSPTPFFPKDRKQFHKSSYEAFTEQDLYRIIFKHLNMREGVKGYVMENAKVEVYDPHMSKFVSISHSSSNPVVHRFGTRIRCILSDIIIWKAAKAGNEEAPKHLSKVPPLAIMGRHFPFNSNGINFAGKRLLIKEIPNNKLYGTALNVWDGAVLLARYLELLPGKVHSKSVLELGAGCGLVGIAAGLLGAKEVTLTDLEYALPLMKENVELNRAQVEESNCKKIRCGTCDWFNPPSVEDLLGLPSRCNTHIEEVFPDVIVVADCVWLEALVDPLMNTLRKLSGTRTKVIFSYQRRGKGAHDRFWNELQASFESILDVDTPLIGFDKPNTFFLFECRKRSSLLQNE